MEPESKEDKFLRWAGAYLITVESWVLIVIAWDYFRHGYSYWTIKDFWIPVLLAPLFAPLGIVRVLAWSISAIVSGGIVRGTQEAIPIFGAIIAFTVILLGTAYALGRLRLKRMAKARDKKIRVS